MGSEVLAAIRARVAAGEYEAAAALAGEAFAGARGEERLELLAEWEEFAYRMRQVGEDMPNAAVAALPRALEAALGDTDLTAGWRALLLAKRARQQAWSQNPRANIATARDALAVAAATGNADALAIARLALHMSLDVLDDAEECRKVSDELVAAARQRADQAAMAMGHWRRQIDRLLIGDCAGYDYDIDALERAATASGDRYWQTAAAMAKATRDLLHGNYERVDEALPELAGAAKLFPGLVTAALTSLGMKSRAQRGRLTPGAGFGRMVTRVRATHVAFRIAMAYSLCSSGRATEAQAELGPVDFAQLPHDNGRVPSLCMAIEMGARHFDDRAMVDQAYALLLPANGTMAMTGDALSCWGPVALYLGYGAAYLGKPEARRHLEDARRMSAAMRARPWLAMSLLHLAKLPSSEGDSERKRQLQESLEIAESIGLVAVATEARALLRPEAAKSRPASRAGLSTREREVLGLMAGGLTAGEIAQRLVLSTRTVEKHIEHAYVKIGARNRAEGIAYAITNGLTGDA